jgi:hypothetical protein
MDLLEHYDSSSSDGDDKNQNHQTEHRTATLSVLTTMVEFRHHRGDT